METPRQVRLGADLVLIHQCISRGIHVSRLYSNVFRQGGFPNSRIRQGFADYVRSLSSVLHAHHRGEDELAFPLFRAKFPEAPCDRLTAEHRMILPLLEEVRTGILQAAESGAPQEPLGLLDRVLTEMGAIWWPHIETEETHFSADKIDTVMTPDEQSSFMGRLGRFHQENSGPDYLVVPFTLYNLPAESRAVLAETMPPAVVRELVPGAWKEKWQAMSPFLMV